MVSDDADNPFSRVISEYHHERSEKQAHQQRLGSCANALVNGWRLTGLTEIINQFNQAVRNANLNLQVQSTGHKLAVNNGEIPYLEYGVDRYTTGYLPENKIPTLKLKLTVKSDCMAHANIKRDNGSEFVLPLEGKFPEQEARELFAAYLRDLLKGMV